MSSSCLKILLALTLLFAITDCRPKRQMKQCHDNKKCTLGFFCILAKKYGNKICAKYKQEQNKNLDYTNSFKNTLKGITEGSRLMLLLGPGKKSH